MSPLRYLLFLDHSHAYLHLHQEQAEGGGPDWRQYREAEGDCRSQQIRHRFHSFPVPCTFQISKHETQTHCSTYLRGIDAKAYLPFLELNNFSDNNQLFYVHECNHNLLCFGFEISQQTFCISL